jgi:hypothetical protein
MCSIYESLPFTIYSYYGRRKGRLKSYLEKLHKDIMGVQLLLLKCEELILPERKNGHDFMHHINSEEHQKLLNMLEESNHLELLDLFCRIYEMKFVDLEKHQLTANHLMAKEKVAKVHGADFFSRPCPCCCIILME